MKTILLTSSGQFIIKNNIDQYLPKKLADCNIAYITTAAKVASDDSYCTTQKQMMTEMGLHYTEIDITDKTGDELQVLLSIFDIILVEGGNTFYLLKTVRETGFEKVVMDLVAKGVVYIGVSAGSYIACPTIEVATWSGRGTDQCGLIEYTAMNLVPFFIKAHYTPKMLPTLIEKRKELSVPLYILSDEQALLSRDGEIEVLGGGDKIVL